VVGKSSGPAKGQPMKIAESGGFESKNTVLSAKEEHPGGWGRGRRGAEKVTSKKRGPSVMVWHHPKNNGTKRDRFKVGRGAQTKKKSWIYRGRGGS